MKNIVGGIYSVSPGGCIQLANRVTITSVAMFEELLKFTSTGKIAADAQIALIIKHLQLHIVPVLATMLITRSLSFTLNPFDKAVAVSCRSSVLALYYLQPFKQLQHQLQQWVNHVEVKKRALNIIRSSLNLNRTILICLNVCADQSMIQAGIPYSKSYFPGRFFLKREERKAPSISECWNFASFGSANGVSGNNCT